MVEEKSFSSLLEAARALGADMGAALKVAIEARGQASCVVSGGNTPKLVLPVLSGTDLDWSKVTVTLSDERWVDTSHHHSNENLVREYLLDEAAAAATFIGLKTDAPNAPEAQAECAERIKALPTPFDAVFLGMGVDGHIASLFPHSGALKAGGVCAAAQSAQHDHWRITLTGQTLLNARHIFLMVNGTDKKGVYVKAGMGRDAKELPVRMVLQQDRVPVTVYLCD